MRRVEESGFSRDGHLLMTATADERVRLWHWKTGRQVGPSFPIGGPQPAHVAFFRDGSRVVVLGQGHIRRWSLPTGDITDLATARRAVTHALGYDVGADDRLTPLTAAVWMKNATALNEGGGYALRVPE